MGLQIILKDTNENEIYSILNTVIENSELFLINENLYGISIPTKIIDTIGEDKIFTLLDKFIYYFLWDGKWYNT
ncbi:hypothetical protein LXN10_01245 [Arcobacter sp. KX21116]|uniref:hypothetical protein n=1 Tax=Arcobacter iocasae TaxID=2906515 RepID=UPI0035D439BA